ncbi:MAG: YidC/Oxa1 family insertase periplasmic-domain containing protein [Phycisphaerales bacterium]|nr:MAG: YidC/Oxa1 family insertase periplasmic-domain containing protein [Phycisphaerales bacterium]
MENKTLIQALLAMMVTMLLWIVVVKTFFPPSEVQPVPGRQPATPTQPALPPSGPSTPSGDRITAQPETATVASPAGELAAVGAEERRRDDWIGDLSGYRQGPYRMKIQGDSRGASISQVLLTDYMAHITSPSDYEKAAHQQLLRPARDPRSGAEYLSMSTSGITLLEGQQSSTVDLSQVDWRSSVKREGDDDQSLRYQVGIERGGAPLLEIEKEYILPAESLDSGRYDVFLRLQVRNVGSAPVTFTLVQDGPVGMPKEGKRSDERSVYGGTLGPAGIEVARKTWRNLNGKGSIDLSYGQPLAWAALANKFFMVLMAPAYDEPDTFGDLIARAEGFSLISDNSELDASSGLSFHFLTSPQTLQPGGDVAFKFACYLGPKARTGLVKSDIYQQRNYLGVLDKGYASCTFVALAKLMTRLLIFFRGILLHNYGLAIIALVLIVRVILHPVTKKGQVNMVKMQEKMQVMQPKLEEIKKKYANDKAKLNQATMEVYRESGLSPAGQMLTCLPMVLQMPIWVALFTSLNYTVEMRHEPFCLWISDLTGTDAINEWLGWHFEPFSIPLLSGMIGQIDAVNILPIILSVTMYLQQRFMPKAASAQKRQSKTPDQLAQQQKIMNFMMVFFGVLFYNAPAGLNLYILSSNVFGMIEQWRIRRHIAVEKAQGKLAPPAPKPRELRQPGFLKKLEKMAEQAKRVQSSRTGRG